MVQKLQEIAALMYPEAERSDYVIYITPESATFSFPDPEMGGRDRVVLGFSRALLEEKSATEIAAERLQESANIREGLMAFLGIARDSGIIK